MQIVVKSLVDNIVPQMLTSPKDNIKEPVVIVEGKIVACFDDRLGLSVTFCRDAQSMLW